MMSHLTPGRYLCTLIGILLLSCSPASERPSPSPSQSTGARPDIVQALRQDIAQPRHPSDGGGRAWIESDSGGESHAIAGETGRWSIVFEVGPEGVAEGGWIFLQAPPFWGWSTPQVVDPEGLGYTTVTTEAPGVELEPDTVDQQLLAIRAAPVQPAPGRIVSPSIDRASMLPWTATAMVYGRSSRTLYG
jgi:hypothetical protein